MKKPDVMSEQIRNLYEYVGMLRNYFEVHSWSRQQTKYDSDFIADINHKLMALCNKVYVLTQVDIAECESQIQLLKQQLETLRKQADIYYEQIQQAKAEVAREIFETVEGFSQLLNWEPLSEGGISGQWREFQEQDWQSLKDRFLKDVKNGNR